MSLGPSYHCLASVKTKIELEALGPKFGVADDCRIQVLDAIISLAEHPWTLGAGSWELGAGSGELGVLAVKRRFRG